MSLLTRYLTTTMTSPLDRLYDVTFDSLLRPYSGFLYNSKYRFVEVDKTHGKLEVELAGYLNSEIEVYTEENNLVVSAKKSDNSRKYFHSWPLEDTEKIESVTYINGLLTINITQVEPEAPRRNFYKIS